jgi:hypothetical protein
VIRKNAQDITPLLRERLRAKTSGNGLDVLYSYEALGEGQLDSLRKIMPRSTRFMRFCRRVRKRSRTQSFAGAR